MACGSVRPARRARRSSSSELRIAGVDGVMEASERGFVAWCLVALPPGSYSTPHQKSRELSRAGLMPKEIAGPARRHAGSTRPSERSSRSRRPGVARFRECRAHAAVQPGKMRNHVSARRAGSDLLHAERRVGTGHGMRLPVPGNAYAAMASAIASATRTARSLSLSMSQVVPCPLRCVRNRAGRNRTLVVPERRLRHRPPATVGPPSLLLIGGRPPNGYPSRGSTRRTPRCRHRGRRQGPQFRSRASASPKSGRPDLGRAE